MSSCSCGLNNNIPKPHEDKSFTPLSSAYDTLKVSMDKGKCFSTMDYVLVSIILIILFILLKDYKWR
jgi:hypothetical protein